MYLAEPDSGEELDVDDGASVDPQEARRFVDDVADAGPLVRQCVAGNVLSFILCSRRWVLRASLLLTPTPTMLLTAMSFSSVSS